VGEPFLHALRVRYSECDSQGVLFNANYLAWVDHTITELWRAAYGGYQTMLERGVDIVVAEANLRFLGAARFDELITLEATVTHLGNTSLRSSHRFRREGELLLEAKLRHVFIDIRTARKTAIPGWARDGLAPWVILDPIPEPEPEPEREPEPARAPAG
jgi:acyl-CoA thioester hydrolase